MRKSNEWKKSDNGINWLTDVLISHYNFFVFNKTTKARGVLS